MSGMLDSLRKNSVLRELELSNDYVTPDVVPALAEMLAANTTLTRLYTAVPFRDPESEADNRTLSRFCDALAGNTTLFSFSRHCKENRATIAAPSRVALTRCIGRLASCSHFGAGNQ